MYMYLHVHVHTSLEFSAFLTLTSSAFKGHARMGGGRVWITTTSTCSTLSESLFVYLNGYCSMCAALYNVYASV